MGLTSCDDCVSWRVDDVKEKRAARVKFVLTDSGQELLAGFMSAADRLNYPHSWELLALGRPRNQAVLLNPLGLERIHGEDAPRRALLGAFLNHVRYLAAVAKLIKAGYVKCIPSYK